MHIIHTACIFTLLPQHSWTNFIYIRCQNVNRKSKGAEYGDKACTPSKKHKADPEKHAYPSLPFDAEDDTATQRNFSLLKQELSKSKPHFDSVTSLMQRTFASRRQWILDSVESVGQITKEYPCLSKSVYVSQVQLYISITCVYVNKVFLFMQVSYEFDLIMKVEKLENAFLECWKCCSDGIVDYAQATKTKSKELKHALRENDTEGVCILLCMHVCVPP